MPVSEDKWIVAMQVLPGNRAVVYHTAITELVLPDGVTPKNIDKLEQVARKLGFAGGTEGGCQTVGQFAEPIAGGWRVSSFEPKKDRRSRLRVC